MPWRTRLTGSAQERAEAATMVAPATDDTLSTGELAALIEAGRLLVSELDVESVLAQLLATARELTGASYAALGILDATRTELERFITRGLDAETETGIGPRPRGHGVLGLLISDPRPLRLPLIGDHPEAHGFPAGHPPMGSFLGVPIMIRGVAWGNLYLTEKDGGDAFTHTDEDIAITLAMWAGIAVDNAKRVAADRLRTSMAAAEAERRRWARELHDETLQRLGGLRVMLAGFARAGEPDLLRHALVEAAEHVSDDIEALRSIITELRPSALDSLGLVPALATLAQRTKAAGELDVTTSFDLTTGADRRLDPELETAIYRLVQEALTNVLRHASAQHVRLAVRSDTTHVHITVTDDGEGFSADEKPTGFGIVGMRERVHLAGGTLTIDTSLDGTTVRAAVPILWSDAERPEDGPPL